MVKKYIENMEELTKLSQRIVKRHPWGYVGVVTQGARGEGKTVFGMKTGTEVYQYLEGISKTDALEKLLGVGNYKQDKPQILFTMEDVVDALDPLDRVDWNNILEWQSNNTAPYKLWDDCGMHGGKYKFFIDVRMVDQLQGLTDVMRFALTGFVMTSPELTGLLGFLRGYHDQLIVTIKRNPDNGMPYQRMAKVKRWVEDKNGRYRLRLAWTTKFSCYVDKWAYEEYSIMKTKAIIQSRNKFKAMLKKAKKMNPELDEYEETQIPKEYEDLINS